MAFENRIRLPFKLTRAQFPEERSSFRKANGEVKTLSVVIRKQYEGETDFLPENWHQRLVIALGHDNIRYEGEKFIGDIAKDGEYNISWPDFLDYPTAKAEFKAQVTPFAETNSNCMTCDEATQLSLEDDLATGLYGANLEEDTDYIVDVAANDNICCYPAVFSITSYNSDYLTSAVIDPATGELTIHTGTGLTSANGLVLLTYRVTCPNGGYDEADVTGNINGTVEGCLAPTELTLDVIDSTSMNAAWIEPFDAANYYWELYEGDSPVGSPVQSGSLTDITSIILSGLTPSTEYYFQVRTVCSEETSSNFISDSNTTNPADADENCGQYRVCIDNGTGNPASSRTISWRNCSSTLQSRNVFNLSCVLICALQSSPGVPVFLNPSPFGTVTYIGLCVEEA